MSWLVLAAFAAEPSATLGAYDAIRVPLVEDRLGDARAAATALAVLPGLDPTIATAASKVAEAEDLPGARTAFGEVSRAYVRDLAARPAEVEVKVFYCPMTPGYGFWLQPGPGLANPYMGTSMPKCGEGTSLRAAEKAAEKVP